MREIVNYIKDIELILEMGKKKSQKMSRKILIHVGGAFILKKVLKKEKKLLWKI